MPEAAYELRRAYKRKIRLISDHVCICEGGKCLRRYQDVTAACKFLHLAAGIAPSALAASSHRAEVETYPTRPVHLLIGFAPDGFTDITARLAVFPDRD